MKFFGTSGIRGRIGDLITPQFCVEAGLATATLYSNVLVGYDTRTTSGYIVAALTSGLLSCGATVTDAQLVTTPTLARAAKKFDCAIMVTASHNPPDYNGLKFHQPDGSGFDTKKMDELETILIEKKYKLADWRNLKKVITYEGAIGEHIESICKSIKSMNLKVVLDCGGGASAGIAPYLFRQLGCEVIALNAQQDGFFPRSPEPTENALELLKKTVRSTSADIGIAYDGDADRMVAVDNTAKFIDGDKLLSLFAVRITKQKAVIPVDASMVIDALLHDKTIIRTKVGDVYISEKIKETNADFGGEPSGTFIFPEQTLCPDGIFASAKLAQITYEEGKLSEIISNLPEFPMRKGSVALHPQKKDRNKIFEAIQNELMKLEYIEQSTLDGIRLQFEDAWVLIRLSGTEPKIRITCEGRTKKICNMVYEQVENIVKTVCGRAE